MDDKTHGKEPPPRFVIQRMTNRPAGWRSDPGGTPAQTLRCHAASNQNSIVLPPGPIDVNALFKTGGQRGYEIVVLELSGAEVTAYVNALHQIQREPPEWVGFRVTDPDPGDTKQCGTDLIGAIDRSMKLPAFIAVGVAVVALSFVACTKIEHDRVVSPDGRFVAVAEFPRYASLLPMAPGASGDKSGVITLFASDGSKVGSARVEMVSFVREIRWSRDEASIPGVVRWRLTRP